MIAPKKAPFTPEVCRVTYSYRGLNMPIKLTSMRDGKWEWTAGGNGGVAPNQDEAITAARSWLRYGS